jgi:Ni,Fe-hydrogenase I cytochrome b subunit
MIDSLPRNLFSQLRALLIVAGKPESALADRVAAAGALAVFLLIILFAHFAGMFLFVAAIAKNQTVFALLTPERSIVFMVDL